MMMLMKKMLIGLGVLIGSLAFLGNANAQVGVSVNINTYPPVYVAPANPVYVNPSAPVYYTPPVYVGRRRVVYVNPGPVYYNRYGGGYYHHRGYHGRGYGHCR